MALGDRSAFDASPRSRRRHRTGTANVKTLDNSGKDNRHTDRQSVGPRSDKDHEGRV